MMVLGSRTIVFYFHWFMNRIATLLFTLSMMIPAITEADRNNTCIDQQQPPVWTFIYGSSHLDNGLVGRPVSNEHFDIFDNDIDLCSLFSCDMEYWLAHWYIKHNLRRAAINELSTNPSIPTVSNFTLSNRWFNMLGETFKQMVIKCWKSAFVCYTWLPDSNNLRDNHYTRFSFHNPVESIDFLMQQPAFKEHMLYAPSKEFNHAEECIYSEIKSSDWWWNEQVR